MLEDATRATEVSASPKRFSWEDVLAMSRAGLFGETERVELEGGEVYVMPEEGPLHIDALEALKRRLERDLPSAFMLSVRGPLHLPQGAVYIPDPAEFA